MNFKKMPLARILLWVVLAFSYAGAATENCAELLKNSVFRQPSANMALPSKYDMVQRILKNSPLFPIHQDAENFWTVLFDPRSTEKNEGWLVRGKMHRGRYFGVYITPAHREEEKNFHKVVAAMHGISNKTLMLNKSHAGCDTITVPGWIESKIWLKHGMILSDVLNLLENFDGKPIPGIKGDPRFRVDGADAQGREVAAVIAQKSECPHILVSAYVRSGARTR